MQIQQEHISASHKRIHRKVARATQHEPKYHPDAQQLAEACKRAVELLKQKMDVEFFNDSGASFGIQFEKCLHHEIQSILPHYEKCSDPTVHPDIVHTDQYDLSLEVRLSTAKRKSWRNAVRGHPEKQSPLKPSNVFYLYVTVDPANWSLEEVWCGWIPKVAWEVGKGKTNGYLLKAVKHHYMKRIV